MIKKIKKYFRRNYLFLKYNHNYESGKLIYINNTDRGFGFTFKVITDSVFTKVPILVSTNLSRKRTAHEIYRMGQLGFVPALTEKYAYDNLVVTPYTNIRGRRIEFVLIDNSCNENDVSIFLKNNPTTIIKNGFVTKVFE